VSAPERLLEGLDDSFPLREQVAGAAPERWAGSEAPDAASKRSAVVVAGLIAAVAAAIAAASLVRAGTYAKDFTIPWTAAHAILGGRDPYAPPIASTYPLGMRFLYPVPAALVTMPLVPVPVRVAGVVFVALSFFALAWALSRDGAHRLPLVASFPALMAALLGQWSPLLLAATLVPALQFAAAAKPTLGIASLVFRPSKLGLALVATLFAVSFLAAPHWFARWLAAASGGAREYLPAVFWRHGIGVLALAAAWRWRDRDARHIALVACLPQMPLFYDQLVLGAIARTRGEVWWVVTTGWIGGLLWAIQPAPAPGFERPARGLILAFIYLPAVALVLWRSRSKPRPR
jgi:hypothetical protein